MIPLFSLFEIKKWKPNQITMNRQLGKRVRESPNFKNQARDAIHKSMISQATSTSPRQRNALYRGAFKLKGMNT